MKTIEEFNRSVGYGSGQGLTNARPRRTGKVVLPRGACVHYTSDSAEHISIRGSHPLIQMWPEDRQIRVYHTEDGYGTEGRYTKVTYNATKPIRAFIRQQARLTPARHLTRALQDDKRLLVIDYTVLTRQVKYTQDRWNLYYEWANLKTAYEARLKGAKRRVQFVPIKLPDVLASLSQYKDAGELIKPVELDRFHSPSDLWVRELFKVVNGVKSSLGTLFDDGSARPDKGGVVPGSDRVYFVVYEYDQSVFLRLDRLMAMGNSETGASQLYTALERLLQLRNGEVEEALMGSDDTEAPGEPPKFDRTKAVTPALEAIINDQAAAGKLSTREQAALVRLAETTDTLPNPFGEGTLADLAKVDGVGTPVPNETGAPVNKDTVPDHATKSSITGMKKAYVDNMLQADVLNACTNFRSAGYIVQDYKVTPVVDVMNELYEYEVTFVAVTGKRTKVKFQLPMVREDGIFIMDGVKYSMDAQRTDRPIRKVGPDRVGLNSYEGKRFVARSARVTDNASNWLIGRITAIGLDVEDSRVTNLQFGKNAVPRIDLPRSYTALMTNLTSFKSGDFEFYFDYSRRSEHFGAKEVKAAERNNMTVCGRKGKGLVTMDLYGNVYSPGGNGLVNHGTITSALGGDWVGAPLDKAVLTLKAKEVPIVLALGYLLGLDGLLRRLKAKVRRVPSNERPRGMDDELVIRFKDEHLVVKLDDPVISMILAGFMNYKELTRRFNVSDFNGKSPYATLLSKHSLSGNSARSFKLDRESFIDPMTAEVLEHIGEPTEYTELLIRAVELLVLDNHPSETDKNHMMLRGMDRLAGAVYKELSQAIKIHKSKPNPGIYPLEVAPSAVWRRIGDDSSVQMVSDLNPIHNLKDQEAVTLSGTGGRSSRSLVKSARVFDKGDTGIISEATPDSAKVAVRSHTSANPAISNMRGLMGNYSNENGSTGVLSTTAVTFPSLHHDDGKRVNMASVQQSAVVVARGYKSMPFRTGGESVIATRVGNDFAVNAKQDGKVTKVTAKRIIVKWANGKSEGYDLGPRHGAASGTIIPHEIVTDHVVGDTVKKGDVILWDEGYFERDLFSPTNVVLKTGVPATIAVLEHNDTYEDGSAWSRSFAELLKTPMTAKRTLSVSFDQSISDLVKVGDEVEHSTVLGTISEQEIDKLGSATEQALAKLANKSPKAKYKGTVTKVEVLYFGDPKDMTPSLRKIAKQGDAERAERASELGRPAATTGQLKRPIFAGSTKITDNMMAIHVYVDYDLSAGTGDKVVVGNQLKSVCGRLMEGSNRSEDGREIDILFGGDAIFARIVLSPIIMGVMNTTLEAASARMADIYFGDA